MHDVLEVTESIEALVDLTEAQVNQISDLSRRLASPRSWWGASGFEDDPEREVIHLTRRGGTRFGITVRNAIGALSLDGLVVIVKPKIPTDHFVFIASRALRVRDRSGAGTLSLAEGKTFLELIAQWLIEDTLVLIRQGLSMDYQTQQDALKYVRGRIQPTQTSLNFMSGILEVESEFDERTHNSPENRIVKSALTLINPELLEDESLRRQATYVKRAFDSIEFASASDLQLPLKAFPARYLRAVDLALSLLGRSGRALGVGPRAAKSFLVKTPPLIEEGIREIIRQGIAPIQVKKGGKVLFPTALRSIPDLVLARPPFTADVKYKHFGSMWNRTDLTQAVFFAESYQSPLGAVIGFSRTAVSLPEVPVGRITISPLVWDISEGTAPEDSARRLIDDVLSWIPEEDRELVVG